MNLQYQNLLPQDFSPSSRIWIYQSNRLFSLSEVLMIEEELNIFTRNWKSHGTAVKGFGTLFFGRFIVLIADETHSGVSGCSTDESVRCIKKIEQSTGASLFDRQLLAFLKNEKIELLPFHQLTYAINNGFISPDTLYFNNTIQHLEELKNQWIVPIKNSWLTQRFNIQSV